MSILQQPFLLHETHEANLEKKWMVPMLVVDKRERKIRLSTFVYAVQCRSRSAGELEAARRRVATSSYSHCIYRITVRSAHAFRKSSAKTSMCNFYHLQIDT